MTERVLLVSAVRNEASTIERVARAIAGQSRPPDTWVIVDDGSSDRTPELLRGFAAQYAWIDVRRARSQDGRSYAARLTAGAPPRALNGLLRDLPLRRYTFIGVVDGDVELPREFTAALIDAFSAEPSLGIAGAELVEPAGGGWRQLRVPSHHVHGGARIYRRSTLESLLPLPELAGWDSVDQVLVRMSGATTRTLPSIVARHHRPCGAGDGVLRGPMRYGASAYAIGQPPAWVLGRAVKIGLGKPLGASGFAFLAGYGGAMVRRAPRVEDREYRRFVRAELRGRLAARSTSARAGESQPRNGWTTA